MRPAAEGDLDGIIDLARNAGKGMTTLPPDPAFIAQRIRKSTAAFTYPPSHPGGEEYLFVVEDGGTIVGTSAIVARVGGFDPFYTYEIRAERVTHAPLGVDRALDVLHLKRDHKGPTELCGLVVDPTRRGQGLGRLASLGRLIYMGAFPGRFAARTIVEIRGVQDAAGHSPFWDGVGSVFFAPNEFAEMDLLTGLGEKDFIADLMPPHPIYVDLLGEDVRGVIGQPHRDAAGALHLLEQQGFARAREVDIFDAGPILECVTAEIGVVRASERVVIGAIADPVAPARCLVARVDPTFRAIATVADRQDGRLVIDAAAAHALQVAPGDQVIVNQETR